MGKALIEFPDDLHRNLKRRAIDEDISLKELIVKAVRAYIEQHPPTHTPTLFDQSNEKGNAE
jgi:hypothetical protein